jgi:hypothetical protein
MFNYTRFTPECDDPLPDDEASPRDPDRIKYHYKKTVKEINEYLVSELKAVQTYFEDALFEEKEGRWKKKWMTKGPKKNKEKYDKINKMFDRTILNEVMSYILQITTYKETERVQKIELMKGKCFIGEHELILFQMDYEDASIKIGRDKSVIKRYMPHIAKAGFVTDMGGGSGTGQNKIYAYGIWKKVPYKDFSTKHPFVKEDDKWLDILASFTVTI